MRIDIWDAAKPVLPSPSLGFPTGLEDQYELGEALGSGGFGVVRAARSKMTGEEFACKAISKTLPDTNDGVQNHRHQANIRREVAVLRALGGALNVAGLQGVFEDEENVYLVLEYCRGGELCHVIGERKYTEATVARFMQAVLLTLVQCHNNGILHRDIKPGNFMLRDESDESPLKAIDFGMAEFFDASKLPRTDLSLDGTPWFMAPETLQSDVYPKSDVWSAGVMAFQLLTGRLPFDDHRNPRKPAISQIWKSILTDRLNFERSFWKGVSDEAKDFVQQLLERDVSKRPTAKEALSHAWFAAVSDQQGTEEASQAASLPRRLHSDVVQRLQRFGQSSLFKRSVLQMIAQEILPMIQSSRHGAAIFGGRSLSSASLASLGAEPAGSCHTPALLHESLGEGFPSPCPAHTGPCSVCGKVASLELTVAGLSGRGLSQYQRVSGGSRIASSRSFGSLHAAAVMHQAGGGSSLHGPSQHQRASGGSQRGSGTRSLHNGSAFALSAACTAASSMRRINSQQGSLGGAPLMAVATSLLARRATVHGGQAALGSLCNSRAHRHAMKKINSMVFERQLGSSSVHGGGSAHGGYLENHLPAVGVSTGGAWPSAANAATGAGILSRSGANLRRSVSRDDLEVMPSAAGGLKRPFADNLSRGICEACRRASECGGAAPPGAKSGSRPTLKRNYSDPELPVVKVSDTDVLQQLLQRLEFIGESMPVAELADNLMEMGFQVSREEAIHLLQQMGLGDEDSMVTKAQFLASQIDWQVLEAKYKDLFLDKARKVFDRIDEDNSGTVSGEEIAQILRAKLPGKDIEEAVHHAFWEAGLLEDMSQSYEDAELTVTDFVGTLGRWHGLDLFEGRNSNVSLFGVLASAETGCQQEEQDGDPSGGRERAVRGGEMALRAMLSEIQE